MNISVFVQNDNVFANCECIKGYAYFKSAIWVNCALLPVICADFGQSQDNHAHFSRFECLLPHTLQTFIKKAVQKRKFLIA